METSGLSPDEVAFVLRLVADARASGITEIQYKELRLRVSLQAQQTGSGPVQIQNGARPVPAASSWNTTIKVPE